MVVQEVAGLQSQTGLLEDPDSLPMRRVELELWSVLQGNSCLLKKASVRPVAPEERLGLCQRQRRNSKDLD